MSLLLLFQTVSTGPIAKTLTASMGSWSGATEQAVGKQTAASIGFWSGAITEVVNKQAVAVMDSFAGTAQTAMAKGLAAGMDSFAVAISRTSEQRYFASIGSWSGTVASRPGLSFAGTAGRRFDVPAEMRITTVAYDARIVTVDAEERIFMAREIP